MLKKILAVLTAKWLITLIGAIVLSLLVWFFGPLLAFFVIVMTAAIMRFQKRLD